MMLYPLLLTQFKATRSNKVTKSSYLMIMCRILPTVTIFLVILENVHKVEMIPVSIILHVQSGTLEMYQVNENLS